jgi:hypothetical protein
MNRDEHQFRAAQAPCRSVCRDFFAKAALAVALGLLMAALGARAADSVTELEYKVKAGYLFNFAKFIEWPVSAFQSTNSPFVIGVLDGGEASPLLRSLFEGKQVNGRHVEVRSVQPESIGRHLHILLVTRAASASLEELLRFAGSASLLMAGETDDFAERGGTIGFRREGDNFRLTLCLEHAAASGLRVNSKLSSVAKLVKSKKDK